MNNIDLYKIWAPDNALWTQWAKPAMFFSSYLGYVGSFSTPKVDYLDNIKNAMVIVDLPGADSVKEGIALAHIGYRPVPLYNGVKGPNKCLINIKDLERALSWGGDRLKELNIKPNAMPAFLLDANRMSEYKYPGVFDNRWCVFPQDMSSADFLINNGIANIIVRAKNIQDDLSHVLCRYQEKNINIYRCYEDQQPKLIKVHKPSRYKSLKYRLKVILGLRRNSAGGFGGYVPDPSQYDSGTGYRGIG